ncbi:MAG: hypothetical protein IPP77_15355 [Bacteroidetes bacterium]|nr:hypothetical protein [Bacteroidota bacterium]
MESKMKLIILGAGKVLEDILCILHAHSSRFEIVAVGVDHSNFESGKPLIAFANHHKIPVIAHYSEVEQFQFDAIFMLSYPPLISQKYLHKYLFINTHYAPLPRYRGFHGFVWSIINGEEKTGITIHQADAGIDSGPIFHQYLTTIELADDILTIQSRLEKYITENIATILSEIHREKKSIPQREEDAIYVCRRRQEDGKIDWNWNAERVFNHIRALTPPYTLGAFTYYKGEKLVIKKASPWKSPSYFSITGQVVAKIPEQGVLIKCGNGVILAKDVTYCGEEIRAFDFFKTVGFRLG